MVEYGDLMVHRRATRKNKDAQARDLPDVDSSWWQSSKDVSDPFAKVSNSFLYRKRKNLVENFPPIGSVDASGSEDCRDQVCVELTLPSLGGRVPSSPLPQCGYNQDLYS